MRRASVTDKWFPTGFWEEAELALFSEPERARRALDLVIFEMMPTAEVVRTWRAFLTEQDRKIIGHLIASLIESVRQDAGLMVVGLADEDA